MNTTRFRRPLVKADLERMNLPEEHWFARIDLVSDSLRSVVARYVHNLSQHMIQGCGLYVFGPPGVGKTTIASIVAKEARSLGLTVLFVRAWELRELIRSRVDFDDDTTMLGRARAVDLLILDDLREEDAGEKFFPLSEIVALIKDRRARRRVTIVTSPVSPQIMAKGTAWRSFELAIEGSLVRVGVEGINYLALRRHELEQAVLGK
jgi:DNA replication protein DnaC